MNAVLEIRHYGKMYGNGKKAADNVNITVQPGEIYGFIGHNGAGKTTTIRAVVGVLGFVEGEILINGHSIKKEPIVCKAQTAYIPDNPDIYDFLTGMQYLDYMGAVFQVDTQTKKQRIQKYAELLGMTEDLGELIGNYSHGMKQKIVLIGAFLHEPKLLVLDEPFVGLDPEASFHLKEMMRELCAKGSAIFFSTHVLDVAEKLCHKVAIIKEGRIIAQGTMEEVKGSQSLEEAFLEVVEHEG
ncbi:MAG TPA: ABC transporter ATP-binding protein [Candidatus Blautia faecavium]|uniref:ABC transporter ATP-binding protein n=1 Tax=Candidatus Blautia faecavium TaxID=2838487 RepID=A0A9D2LUN8_9FIRM|nr:ABC transporter ATP-binding protein [Candidatus Blautia faecavium]